MHLRLALSYILALVLLQVISLVAMPPIRLPFHCIPTCSRTFQSPRALSIHHKSCTLFKEEQLQRMHALAQASEAQDAYNAIPFIPPPPSPEPVSGKELSSVNLLTTCNFRLISRWTLLYLRSKTTLPSLRQLLLHRLPIW